MRETQAAPRLRATPAQQRRAVGNRGAEKTTRAPLRPTVPTSLCRFVTWNVQCGLDKKSAALERLLLDCELPEFVALQEIGECHFENSTVAGVLQQHGYNCHFHRRQSNPKCGGAALLVRNTVNVEQCDWKEATAWPNECEAVSVRAFPPNGGAPFVVTSLYIHGTSSDTAGFRRLIFSAPADQVLLTDANAQMPGSRPDGRIAPAYKERGQALRDSIIDRGAWYPTPAGPTRRDKVKSGDKSEFLDTGTYNDHVVVGPAVVARLASFDEESIPLYDIGCSDHAPLVWAGELGGVSSAPADRDGHRITAWHRITDQHRAEFNRVFRKTLEPIAARRKFDMLEVERALASSDSKALPHAGPLRAGGALYFTEAAAHRIQATVDKQGDAAQRAITEEYRRIRRETLARDAPVEPTSSSAWRFTSRLFGFNPRTRHRGRVETSTPGEFTATPQQRVDALAEHYAAAHANPPNTDARAELRQQAALIPPPVPPSRREHKLSALELKACVATAKPGRCADRFGLRAEHVRMLDDQSLQLLVPFFERCVSEAKLPRHWRESGVSPALKKKRDPSLRKSWRPISVTMLLCRLCEVIVHNRILHAMSTLNLRAGKAQFGYLRGVETARLLSGLSMFVCDGFRQATTTPLWDATDPAQRDATSWGDGTVGAAVRRTHATLLVSVDASDAFCRASPAAAVKKLRDMDLIDEARWVAELLADRTLVVREDNVTSASLQLDRGLPQGTVLGPLLWSLVIDDLIAELRGAARSPLAGCVAVPIIFADDINFAIRGFNPSSHGRSRRTICSRVVREWADGRRHPDGQAAGDVDRRRPHAAWARTVAAQDGRVIYERQGLVHAGRRTRSSCWASPSTATSPSTPTSTTSSSQPESATAHAGGHGGAS